MRMGGSGPPFLHLDGGRYDSRPQARCSAVFRAGLGGVLKFALCSQEVRWAVNGTVCGGWIAIARSAVPHIDLKQALNCADQKTRI